MTVRLRGLLRSYPRSIGIVKELLQNADDAGATRLLMIWDGREHARDALPDPRMSRLQGPALLFANDQVFSEADFQAIRSIGESSKSELGPKTGRFGLGFNTVYNVSDYPSFASGRWAIAFDPHRDAVAEGEEPTGKRWELAELWDSAGDWLRPFACAGLAEGEVDFQGTIFRLPARTPEQAKESEICDEPFTRADFEQMLRDLEGSGDELLLFARNILELRVREIDPSGEAIEHLVLATRNRDDVVAARAIGNVAVEGDTATNIVSWRADVDELPHACYRHLVEVHSRKGEEVRAWQVVTGLFADSFDRVLRLNEQMLALREKALPWVGAAIRLDLHEDGAVTVGRQRGKVFCTFPLPDQPGLLPCHVNGCFDLDPSRRQISTDPELYAEADRVRVAWNRALLEHAAPQAAALAIAALIPEVGARGLGAFYELWPDLSDRHVEPWRSFAGALLRRLAALPLVQTRASDVIEWRSLKETKLPPPLWGEDLGEALRDDGLRLPDPDLPPRVAKNAERAGVTTIRYKPQEVRDWLRLEAPLEVPLEEAPRRCLRERSHVVDLLQFCISDRKDDIAGLPLALGSDGLLRAFGLGGALYLADGPTRRLFAQHREWFIDVGIQSNTRLRPCAEASLAEMDLPLALTKLAEILAPDDDGARRRWEPGGEALPNAEWLADVLRFLSERAEGLAEGALIGMTLLPDQRGRLHAASEAGTHLLVTDLSDRPLIDALTELDVDLIGAEPPLGDALRNFHRRCPGLMEPLAGPSLATALGRRSEAVAALPGAHRARDLLLDYLATPTWLDAYDDATRATLRGLPLLRTLGGRPVRADDPGVYLPAGFNAPPLAGLAFEIVDTGPRDRWRPLLAALGVPALDRSRFIADVFLAAYAGLVGAEQVTALRWLRDDVDLGALASAEPELAERLRLASLIVGRDGALHPASELYDPGDGDGLLGQQALVPDLEVYADDRDAWRALFTWLGLRESPQAAALLRHVDALRERADDDLGAAEDGLRELLAYLDGLWPIILQRDPAEAALLAEELKGRAWLPALRSADAAAFEAPPARLFRSDELVDRRDLGLVASQMPALDADGISAAFLTAIGVAEAPPPAPVAAHLAALRDRWSAPDHGGLEAAALDRITAAIYGYFGALAEAPAPELLAELVAGPCVWDGARFWRPEHAFAVSVVDLFGDRRGFVPGDGDGRRGLDRLGRRGQVEAVDIAAMLAELAEGGRGRPLDAATIDLALRLVRRLVDLREVEEAAADATSKAAAPVHVPTADRRLLASDRVFVGDAPWLVDRLRGAPIALLHSKVGADAIARLGIRRLSAAAREELAEAPALSGSPDKLEFCRDLARTIHHPLFAAGLRRLLVASGQVDGAVELGVLAGLKLQATDHLVTQLRIDGVDQATGVEEVAIFADDHAGVVYIGADHWDTVVVEVAAAIDRLVGGGLENLAHLEAILRTPPPEIQQLLDRRRVPRVQGDDEVVFFEDPFAERQEEEPPPATTSRAVGVERLAFVGGGEVPRVSNEVVKAAITAAVEHERDAGRKPMEMPPGTPGYDVQSGRISDPNARFIRVLGLDGGWERLPVILSSRDAAAARTFGRQYWLYVVEHARDPGRRKVQRIQDPLPRIARYALDQRWREQAERDGSGLAPQVGWIHVPEAGEPAEILAIEKVGMFTWLRVRAPGGAEERRFFKPALDRVVPEK
ncbi:MAG: DUF3883 domain-containing protein [Myxococcales bacterium]|nr:DUF3883 domain-containing protein [Myxococcales bacterium]